MKKLIFFFTLCFGLNLNSQTWQDVAGGSNNSSHCMTLWNGKLIDGGSFNNPCNRIMSWNDTVWNCFAGGVGLVARDAIEYNGDLIVVGDFWNVQQPCSGCNGIAKWDGTSWTPLGTGFNNDVLCLTIWNGDLVAGGDFTQADGNPVSRIARWDGTQWIGIGGTSDFSNDIRAMTEYDGELWVGGDFANAGGCSACDGLVKWDVATSTWVGGDVGVDVTGGVDSTVRVLYVDPSTNLLYMGGHFDFLNLDGVLNYDCSRVAVYDGSDWTPLGTGVNSYVRAIHNYNGNIIVGGDFNIAGSVTANKIAKWNPITTTWTAMGTGMNDYVKSMAVYNGSLYAGGPFTTADGLTRNYIAKWYETPAIAPTAIINASATSVCVTQCINFTDNSSNSPTGWTWNFPGGSPSSSSSQNPGSVCFSSPGSYDVTLTACNANGCNTTTQTIVVTNTPNVTVNNLSICNGQSGSLNATGASTYTWLPSTGLSATTGASVIANPTVTTTYTVTGTNAGGCTNSATATVTVNNLPVATATNDGPYCENQTIQLNSIAGFATDDWIGPNGYSQNNLQNPSIINATLLMNGIYTVTVTNAAGCSATATTSVTVNAVPIGSASNTGPYCLGETIQLNSSGATNYTWTGPLSFTSSSQNPTIMTATLSMTGNYSVTISNVAGCSTNLTTYVSVVADPIPTASNTGPYCEGEDIQLNSTGGGTYNWIGPASFSSSAQDPLIPSADLSMNGIYTVTVTLAGGCSASTTTLVVVNNVPGNIISANGPTTFCEGSSVLLTASLGNSYLWNTTETSPSISVNTSGTYSVEVTNANGCTSTASIPVNVIALPDISVNVVGFSLTAVLSGANYQWVDCNNSFAAIPLETNQTFNATLVGNYAVIIQQNGCTDTSDCQVITNSGLSESTENNNFILYPNPSSDFINFEIDKEGKLVIYDMFGKTLLNCPLLEGKQKIDIHHLSAGVYFLSIESPSVSNVVKLIKD